MVLLLESASIRASEWVMHEVLYAMRHKLGLLSLCWDAIAGDENCVSTKCRKATGPS